MGGRRDLWPQRKTITPAPASAGDAERAAIRTHGDSGLGPSIGLPRESLDPVGCQTSMAAWAVRVFSAYVPVTRTEPPIGARQAVYTTDGPEVELREPRSLAERAHEKVAWGVRLDPHELRAVAANTWVASPLTEVFAGLMMMDASSGFVQFSPFQLVANGIRASAVPAAGPPTPDEGPGETSTSTAPIIRKEASPPNGSVGRRNSKHHVDARPGPGCFTAGCGRVEEVRLKVRVNAA